MARRYITYGLPGRADSLVSDEFENLETNKQDIKHKIFTRVPLLKEIAEGQLVLALVSGALKTYTRVRGTLYTQDWVLVP